MVNDDPDAGIYSLKQSNAKLTYWVCVYWLLIVIGNTVYKAVETDVNKTVPSETKTWGSNP